MVPVGHVFVMTEARARALIALAKGAAAEIVAWWCQGALPHLLWSLTLETW